MRKPLQWTLALGLVLSGIPAPAYGQDTHLLVVVGLGGDPDYRELFHQWAVEMVSAAETRFGVPRDRIVYLGERPADFPEVVDGRSTLEDMASAMNEIAGAVAPEDQVLVVLIGHGTGQGEEVEFNLPGPDLTPTELDRMLDGFPTQTVAVVNASSSSGPFLPVLSDPNRVILTATRSAQERNETQFGGFFVEAWGEDGSDLDKDGRLSLAEAFRYASREVSRYYEALNLLATEHAQLDDNGDGEGSSDLEEGASDGRLAERFWLGRGAVTGAAASLADSLAQVDPEMRRLLDERADLERRVRELRILRGQMEEARYESELEALLVELALKNREIREKGGGAP